MGVGKPFPRPRIGRSGSGLADRVAPEAASGMGCGSAGWSAR
jgi:hypothetical protein